MIQFKLSLGSQDVSLRLIVLVVVSIIAVAVRAQVAGEHLDSVINSLNLEEVVVKAKKVRQQGDTISFTASSYIKKDDKVLEDLLKKMPGIEVTSDGQVKYNGQWINEFYIEGSDLLGDNYSVATKNIDAQAIGSVQIMENHQDRKILQGTQRGTAPAMNIRLKRTAKGVWSSTMSAALGTQPGFSRDISATLMNFQRNLQNISVIKTNNIGSDLRREIHATENNGSSLGTAIVTPQKPDIPDIFSYRNNSYLASINQLFKLNDEKTLTCNINYLYDKERQQSMDITTYTEGEEVAKEISEQNNASLSQHYVGGHVVYKQNSAATYLKNNLSFNFAFPDNYGLINDYLRQNVSGHYVSVDDHLDANYKRKGGGIADANFDINYKDITGNLGVENEHLTERVNQRILKVNGVMSVVALKIPHLMFNLNGKVTGSWQKVTASLGEMNEEYHDGQTTSLLSLSLVPKVFLHFSNKFQWLFYVPLGIKYYQNKEESMGSYHRLMFAAEPYSNITFKPGDRVSFDLTVVCKEDLPDALTLMVNKRYINYRSTVANPSQVELWRNHSLRSALTASYKDVVRMLFGNITLSYAYTHNGSCLDYEFADGNVVNYVLLPQSTSNRILQVGQALSKGFFKWNSKISESLTVGTANTEYYLTNALHKGRNNYLQASLSYTAQPTKRLSFSTVNDFSLTKAYSDGKANGIKFFIFANKSALNFWLTRNLCIEPSIQYNYNDYFDDGRNNTFLNCKAEYYIKSIILFVNCNNLLDSDSFRRITDNGVIRYVSQYDLRGRTLMFGIRIKLT